MAKIAGIEKEVAKIAGIEKEVAEIAGIKKEVAKIAGIEQNLSLTAKAVVNLTIDVQEFKDEVREGFKQVDELKASQERLESTQQEILALLRGRSQ